MAFSKDYADILFPFVEKYKTVKNTKARTEVLKNTATTISQSRDVSSREDNVTELPNDLQMVHLSLIFLIIWLFPYRLRSSM